MINSKSHTSNDFQFMIFLVMKGKARNSTSNYFHIKSLKLGFLSDSVQVTFVLLWYLELNYVMKMHFISNTKTFDDNKANRIHFN